jgi:hypothetical protein
VYFITSLKRITCDNGNTQALVVAGDKRIIDLYMIFSEIEEGFEIGRSS